MDVKTYPFRHLVIDHYFDADRLRAAVAGWPGVSQPGWHLYDSPLEKKWALPHTRSIPPLLCELLGSLLSLPVGDWLGIDDRPLIPDAGLHGAGLHQMGDGDHLDVHLDADRHPVFGWERRANAILFLTDGWQPGWGGALEFWNATLTRPVDSIEPQFGRLVLFETSDASYHGVPQPIRCPAHVERRSLAAYWWAPAPRGPAQRPRAQFVATAGEAHDPVKEALRRERMR